MSPKGRAILDAAFGVFAQYGIKRASMADIARASGMSRPALYQYFSNKDDIIRSLVVLFYEKAAVAVEAALSQPGSPETIILKAFQAKSAGAMQIILRSPHGRELLDVRNSAAHDVVREGEDRLVALFSVWLSQTRRRSEISFDGCPDSMARTLLYAHEGLKSPPFDQFEIRQEQLAILLGRGLTAGLDGKASDRSSTNGQSTNGQSTN